MPTSKTPLTLGIPKLDQVKVHGRLLQTGKQKKSTQSAEMHSLLAQSSMSIEPSISTPRKQVKGRLFRSNTEPQVSEGNDPNLVELFQVIEESNKSTDVPAPRMITLERQLFQSILISWKPPELSSMNDGKIVSAYHIYVDGQFRLAVMAKEKTRALIDNVDADKPHRISIRSISSHGQSKDAQCTLVVGRGMTATPARLKATQIGTKSAKLSWIPGNSNYYHRVYLNECPLHLCKPGVYKLHLTDLPPDTLHQVCVQALPSPISTPEPFQQPPPWINASWSGVYTQKLAAFIEFRTLPIGLPDPPSHVQIEAGPQDGMLLITWLPVPQDKGAADAVTAAGAGSSLPVQGYTVCLNGQAIMELQGASRDHAILKLSTIKDHVQRLMSISDQSVVPFENSSNNNNNNIDFNNSPISNQVNSSKFSNPLYTSANSSSIIELYITVHSTVPLNSIKANVNQSSTEGFSEQGSNSTKSCHVLKGSEGPASKPIRLTACLLIAAAGSLEAAYTVFGPSLAVKLGINEDSAKMAGVSLSSVDGIHEINTYPNAENLNSDDNQGLLIVSAGTVTRKPSPTADALGSAEALLLRRKLEKQELSDDSQTSSDHHSAKPIKSYSQTLKVKSTPQQSSWETRNSQKTSTDRNYDPRYHYPHSHHHHHQHPAQRHYHQQRSHKHTKHRLRQTRSISDEYELNAKSGLPKDAYYHSDEASLNSSVSSESFKESANRWFRTSSSYNLTTDYPNRRWKPRGGTRSYSDRGYPHHEYHRYSTNERMNRKEGIQRRQQVHSPYDNRMYPVHGDQQSSYSSKHPKSFKSFTYSGRISPDPRHDIISKYGTRILLDHYYPDSRYTNYDVNPFSSSSNEERYPETIYSSRSHLSPRDRHNRLPFSNILTPQTYMVNTRSRSTSPKRIHKFSVPQPTRNTETDYCSFPNVPIHRTPKHYRPLAMGSEGRRWPIRQRYYSAHGNPYENLSLPEIQITRNSSLSDNERQFQVSDPHQQQQSQFPYQNIRGPIRPIRSRFMDTRRHGSHDPQSLHHDPAYSRQMIPADATAASGSKRSLYHNMPSLPNNQHEHKPPLIQGNTKGYRSGGDQGYDPALVKSGNLRQSVGAQHQQQQLSSQYSRSGKPFTQDDQQYNLMQRHSNEDYPVRMMPGESKPIQVVVALYDYDPATMSPNIDGVQEELPFREGQLIKILSECDEDGFYLGECNGLRGLVPSNMVSELEGDLSRVQKYNHTLDPRTNLTESSFIPPGQMSKTRSVDVPSQGQSQGQVNSSSKNYYVSRTHDRMIPQTHSTPRNMDMMNEHTFHPSATVSNYSEVKDIYPDEMTPDRNLQSQQAQSKYTDSMHTPRTLQNKPLEKVKHPPDQEARIMTAIYDYDPHVLSPNADIDAELSFRSGEQITVFGDMDDDGFYYGETRDGRRGLVPSNFLQPCTNEINFSSKPNSSSNYPPPSQMSSTNPRDHERQKMQTNRMISSNRDQGHGSEYNNQPVRIQSQSNPPAYQSANYIRNTKLETVPSSEKERLAYNPRSSSPRLQTSRPFNSANDSEVIDNNNNFKSPTHPRDDYDRNGIGRFPENEEESIIVMDLNPYPNNPQRKSNFPSLGLSRGSSQNRSISEKDYDSNYVGQNESGGGVSLSAGGSGSGSGSGLPQQRRRSTIRSLFKRE
ncbi:unnamed protein product [Trichobilharzia szidati]|nr:unnamed protein product [Trichobilharzia szidati]